MEKLANEGYLCLAPNQRGYGKTSKPTDVKSYDVDILVTGGHSKYGKILVNIYLLLNNTFF